MVDVAALHLLLISTLAKLGDTHDQVKSRETVAKVAEDRSTWQAGGGGDGALVQGESDPGHCR